MVKCCVLNVFCPSNNPLRTFVSVASSYPMPIGVASLRNEAATIIIVGVGLVSKPCLKAMLAKYASRTMFLS